MLPLLVGIFSLPLFSGFSSCFLLFGGDGLLVVFLNKIALPQKEKTKPKIPLWFKVKFFKLNRSNKFHLIQTDREQQIQKWLSIIYMKHNLVNGQTLI